MPALRAAQGDTLLNPKVLSPAAQDIATQATLHMLRVDRLWQVCEFAHERTDPREVALEQARLEPAIEPLDGSVALGACGWNKDRFDPVGAGRCGREAQAQANDA